MKDPGLSGVFLYMNESNPIPLEHHAQSAGTYQ